MLLRILFLCALVSTPGAAAQSVRIGVLGLFHPREIALKAVSGQALVIHAERNNVVLEKSSGQDSAEITISGDAVIFKVGNQTVRTPTLDVSGRSGEAADFVLSIPGRISRRYRGILQVSAESGMLAPVVQMELETAVASVVQAESAPGTPLEALKAQAIASRSYFIAARGRHETFDFCDTTHCQFLREPPPPDSNAVRAALATRGLRLIYREHAVAAMFTRSCGGRTHTSQQVGLSTQNYPYFSVACDYCLRHPVRWVRRVRRLRLLTCSNAGKLPGWSWIAAWDGMLCPATALLRIMMNGASFLKAREKGMALVCARRSEGYGRGRSLIPRGSGSLLSKHHAGEFAGEVRLHAGKIDIPVLHIGSSQLHSQPVPDIRPLRLDE